MSLFGSSFVFALVLFLLLFVTISKEFMKMFEMQDKVEELQKFTLIEKYVLKYVATSQSLYV